MGNAFDCNISDSITYNNQPYYAVADSSIQSLADVKATYDTIFSSRYPVIYESNEAFIEHNDQVYELYIPMGVIGTEKIQEIVKKSDDEVWFSTYMVGPDGTISETPTYYSFVLENGSLKYGTRTDVLPD